jgi:hypothetical protein
VDVLNAVIKLADDYGLFSLFERSGMIHRLSLFADDIVMLVKLIPAEEESVVALLEHFGMASGLHCNLMKSSALLIRCEGLHMQPTMCIVECLMRQLTVQYLGLALSLTRLSKSD